MKKLLLVTTGGIAVLALILSAWIPFGDSDHVAVYKPRSAKSHMEYGAHGAIETMIEMKKNYFTGQVEPEDMLRTRQALNKFSKRNGKDNDMEWSSLGPDNIGGRTRALWIDPSDDNHLIGGGVSGGLWQSFDAGDSWQPMNGFNKHPDFYQHMTISSITRTGSGIYYVGTGSQHENFNWSGVGTPGFVGGGVFRSLDPQGNNWETVNDFVPDPFSTNSDWTTVDAIVIDPNNPEKMWIGHSRGLDVYIHGNDDLEERPDGLPGNIAPCEDVHISTDGEVIVASVGGEGFLSTDGGNSFEEIGGNLENGGINFIGQASARLEFAISPTDPDYIYGVSVNNNNSLKGVAATFDRGETWYRIAVDVNDSPQTPFQPFGGVGGQGVWDCTIVVNPLNPKQIFVGGLIIYSHTSTGNVPALSSWEARSIYSTNYLNPFAVHPDVHWFVWDSNNVFYAATDGGFFKSDNMATAAAPTFYPANQGYITTQFYGIAHANDDKTLGGTQDNGTLYQNFMGVTENSGIEVFGGDGFDCDISYLRPNLLFGSSQNGNVFRSLGGTGFGELISPDQVLSGDFTTNIRLVETRNDPYSTRGNMFVVDTLYEGFQEDYMEWDNGDITLGFVPAGFTITHIADADQSELYTTLDENLYYYLQKVQQDTVLVPYLDTTDVIIDLEVIDSVLFPIDTTFTIDCDTLVLPLDTTYALDACDTTFCTLDTCFVDSCVIFLGEEFCVTVDTLYQGDIAEILCDTLGVSYTFFDSIECAIVDTLITFETEYEYDTTFTYITEELFEEVIQIDTLSYVADSVFLIDPVQSLFVYGPGTNNGIWVTRDALNTSVDPEWWNVGNTSQFINCLEWSPDRDHLYVGTAGGQLIRISGFNKVYYEEDLDSLTSEVLITGGAPISDIAVDYSQGTGGPNAEPASEMVVVSKCTYGTQDKVEVSMTAASTTSSNTFTNIWNIEEPLNRMPVYSCVIAKDDPETIVIGTEVGIFRTNNGGETWVEENGGGMDRVPVLDLRQQYREAWEVENSGVIYAGTHGRGIFKNEDFFLPNTGIDDVTETIAASALSGMKIFPNPLTNYGWVEFELNQPGNVRASIFTIKGQLVENIVRDNMPKGEHQIRFDAERLTAGTYILVLESGGTAKNGRFIVTK